VFAFAAAAAFAAAGATADIAQVPSPESLAPGAWLAWTPPGEMPSYGGDRPGSPAGVTPLEAPACVPLTNAFPMTRLPSPAGFEDAKAPPAAADSFTSPVVRQLPADPGSAALFFVALGPVGAWRLCRSANKLRFSHLPDWYHTGRPLRIGRVAPCDLQYPPGAFCALDVPGDRQRLRTPPRRDLPRCPIQQSSLAVDAPRGPPPPHS